MDSRLTLILIVGAVLCLVCAVYAWALEHVTYAERDTWKAVVVGNGFILIALGALSLCDVVAAAVYWLIVGYNVVAGLPVIIWQLVHYAREAGQIEAQIAERRSRNGQEEEEHAINARSR